jgi:hypothetical protein
MKDLYQITIHGRTMESRDLRQLLARAVTEKRNMDLRLRFLKQIDPLLASVAGSAALSGAGARRTD